MHGTETSLFDHATELLKAHEKLLGDTARNRAFYEALKKRVTAGATVLDIGSGTGVWAIVAAKLGARRVVAVEQDPLLIGLIKSLARANGVADRVEAIAGDSTRIGFGQKFDIVVSETIGNLAFEEQIIPIMIDARSRHLNPGGSIIPERVALMAAAVRLKPRQTRLPAGIELEYEGFEWLAGNIPVGVNERSRLELLSEPKELLSVDLATVEAAPEFADMSARWRIDDASQIDGFAIWAVARLGEGVVLNALETTSWTPLLYRTGPFNQRGGVLEFKLTLTPTSNYWAVTLLNEADCETQTYSPAYAASLLLAQSRTDADVVSSPQRNAIAGLLGIREAGKNFSRESE